MVFVFLLMHLTFSIFTHNNNDFASYVFYKLDICKFGIGFANHTDEEKNAAQWTWRGSQNITLSSEASYIQLYYCPLPVYNIKGTVTGNLRHITEPYKCWKFLVPAATPASTR